MMPICRTINARKVKNGRIVKDANGFGRIKANVEFQNELRLLTNNVVNVVIWMFDGAII
jgi:hypothetical protein